MMLVAGGVAPMLADATMIEGFNLRPPDHWRFFADTVMGGVASGAMRFVTEDGRTHARMTGHVSTDNNGGFIQIQRRLSAPPPEGTTEVRPIVRGHEQGDLVHLPFDTFRPAGGLLPAASQGGSLTAVAIVAYGRDHDSEIDMRELGFS